MIDDVVVAYHEAGHAMLAECLGARVLSVTIVPNIDDGPRRHGETKIAWRRERINPQQLALRQARVAIAGPVAEMIVCNEQYEPEIIQEWWSDWLMAAKSVRQIKHAISDRLLLEFLANLVQELIEWMSQDEIWHRIARLADELEAHETLESDHLQELRELGVL